MNTPQVRRFALRMAVATAIAAAFVGLVGCSPHTTGSAHSEPPPAPAVPNLDTLGAVDAQAYYVPLRGGPSYQFVTPDRVSCDLTFGGMRCSQANAAGCTKAGPTNNGRATPPFTYTVTNTDGACQDAGNRKLLDTGAKLVAPLNPVGVFTCGAGTDGQLVCIDDREGHGFVVAAGGVSTF